MAIIIALGILIVRVRSLIVLSLVISFLCSSRILILGLGDICWLLVARVLRKVSEKKVSEEN